MFRAVPMMRLQAIVLARDERAVVKGLGDLGAVQLMRTPPETALSELVDPDFSGDLTRHDRIKSQVRELRQALNISPPAEKPGPAVMSLNEAEEHLRLLEQRGENLTGRRQKLLHRQKELAAVHEHASPYRGFHIPLEGQDHYAFLHFAAGSLPAENFEGLLKEAGPNAVIFPVAQQKEVQSILAVTAIEGRPALEKALQEAGFQRESLPAATGKTLDKLLEEGENENEQLAAELKRLDEELVETAAELSLPLAEIEEFADSEYRILEASQYFSRTEAVVFIAGWIPASEVNLLDQCLKEITGGRHTLRTTPPDPSQEDETPVLLRHSPLLRPFSMLVSTYGFPNYHELEPTLFVALSYIIMFGLMFGDAGHGLVLATCGLLPFCFKRFKKARDLGVLLLSAGMSSMIFGVIYGSYFGIEAFKHYALWHDPLDADPMRLMLGSIGIGVILISIGLILNVINRFQRGDMIGGLLDKFGLVGILFYWGSLVLLTNWSTVQSLGLTHIAAVVVFAVPIVGWCLKEPLEHLLGHKNSAHEPKGTLAGDIIESCVGAFEAILSYLANTISFVRLAAYAMSHAALLFAAFMLAAEVKKFPVGGGILSLVIIIFGNIIAIVLEGIIASVQALRLEYYEFFGKFYSGSGQPFRPFSLKADGKSGTL